MPLVPSQPIDKCTCVVMFMPTRPDCRWDIANCGPNEETFSFHPGGAHVTLCDGSVQFVSENIDARVFTAIMSPNGGETEGF